jgi:uncharacterized damage-inducible protein DinB
MTSRQSLIFTPAPATTAEVGTLLGVLHDARVQTLKRVGKVADLDAVPGRGHSAGTLLYHIALIELDWLFADVLEKPEAGFPAETRTWFPLDARDEEGRLSTVGGEPLEHHLARLAWVRGQLDSVFGAMTLTDLRRPRQLDDYDVTPEWVLMHLALHEAHHEGQLALPV